MKPQVVHFLCPSWSYAQVSGIGDIYGCNVPRYWKRGQPQHLTSTDPEKVTCPTCRKTLARATVRALKERR